MPANAWKSGESPEDRKYARAARESQRRQGPPDDRRTYVIAGLVLVALVLAALLLRSI